MNKARKRISAVGTLAIAFLFTNTSQAAMDSCPATNQIPGSYILKVKTHAGLQAQSNNLEAQLLIAGAEVKTIQKKKDALKAQSFSSISSKILVAKNLTNKELLKHDDIMDVSPDCRVDVMNTPNDPRLAEQNSHALIDISRAWQTTTGSKKIIVAISDTGVDHTHEDLRANMWVNTAEANGRPGVDDDGNGFIDDIHGYDHAENDGDPRPGISNHGTHVAGIVGATGNNGRGVVGVNWNVSLMGLKGWEDDQAGGLISALVEGIYYAVDNGAHIINMSWGIPGTSSQALLDAFSYAKNNGVLMVVAAGNNALNAQEFYPANVPSAFTVGSYSENFDNISNFSNWGTGLDILAPGEFIMSTVFPSEGYYGRLSGTSMAAPKVAGLAALMLSVNPTLSLQQLETLLKSESDIRSVVVPDNRSVQFPGSNKSFVHPMINAAKAVEAALLTLGTDNDREFEESTRSEDNENSENGSLGSEETIARSGASTTGGCGAVLGESNSEKASTGTLFLLTLIFMGPMLLTRRLRRK